VSAIRAIITSGLGRITRRPASRWWVRGKSHEPSQSGVAATLARTAIALHVHRNIVICRRAHLAGRDIRDRRYAIALYLAC
jgi:hypothetical protein